MTRRVLRRLKGPAVNAGMLLCSLMIAMFLVEMAFRLVQPQQLILIRPDLWRPADTVGWLRQPNVDVQINTGERTVRVRTDSTGFRVGGQERPPARLRVLLLGDSFMEALQVDHEASVAGLLEEKLPLLLSEPVAVDNAAVGGWDPDQYLLYARSLLSDEDYDLVITAVYLGNDVISGRRDYLPPREPVRRYAFRFPRSLSWPDLIDSILRPANDFLEVRSHLFIFAKNQLQGLRMRVGLAQLTFPAQYLRSEADGARWEVTADLLEEIAEVAAQHGTESLFAFIPARFQVDSTGLRRYVESFDLDPAAIDLDQPNRRLAGALDARGIRAYDVLPLFRTTHAEGVRLFGSVDKHFSPDGNLLFAEFISRPAADLLSQAKPGAEAR